MLYIIKNNLFRRNVDCGDKADAEIGKSTTTASPFTIDQEEEDDEEDPKSLKEVLAAIKEAGQLLS